VREPHLCAGCGSTVLISEALLDTDDDGAPIYFCSLSCADELGDELDEDAWDPIAEDRED